MGPSTRSVGQSAARVPSPWESWPASWLGPAASLRAGCCGPGGGCCSGVAPGWGLAVSPGTSALCPHSLVKAQCEFLLKSSSRFSTTSPVLYGMSCDKL